MVISEADQVIRRTLARLDEPAVSTRLVKLVYLIDYLYFQSYGRTLTGFQYEWDHCGPDAVGHAIARRSEELARNDLIRIHQYPNNSGGITSEFKLASSAEVALLPPEAEMIIQDVVEQYGGLSLHEIAELTKQTEPFRDATQYSVLSMRQSAPAGRTTASDWDAYQRDLQEQGALSLEEVKRRYSLP